MTNSQAFSRAKRVIPGGVNSPVRAFHSVGGTPIFMQSANGAFLKDIEGKEYIDYIGSWGPMILGHGNEDVQEAVISACKNGTSFGAPTEIETRIAEMIVDSIDGVDKVRMVNSGTEACMSAVRLARGYTGKEKIIKFEGCYHGHSDTFLIAAGSGAADMGTPSSPGVTQGTSKDTLLCRYNDPEQLRAIFEQHGKTIAAVIVEPVAGNMGCIPPNPAFLAALRDITSEFQSLLIFDEVMTGFRLGFSGMAGEVSYTPDLICWGKVIGGGLPVGAFGGKKEIMDHLAPIGKVYQAGTLSGNPLAMAAGYALLTQLKSSPDIFTNIQRETEALEVGLHSLLERKDVIYTINRKQSMISLHFGVDRVENFEDAQKADAELFKQFFHACLKEGVYLAPSAFETWFVSAMHTPDVIESTLEKMERALGQILV